MTKLLFGCGYLGSRVAERWRDEGHQVTIVTRSDRRAAELSGQGYTAIVADVTRPESLAGLPAAETVLYAVGFDQAAGQSIREVYEGGVRNVLASLPADSGRFIYISTTGVYASAGGDWVDEQTPTDPQRPGAKAALAAEEVLRAHPLAARGVILRLAGIYGPGRVPFLKELAAGEPIATSESGHLNLIHVHDAAAVVLAAERLAPNDGPAVYCVSDGRPIQRGEFYRQVAERIAAAEPRFAPPDPASPRAARAASDKRVRNDRLLRELRVRLRYPSYREGLVEILAER